MLGGASGVLGALCVLAALCFRFPHYLVYGDARSFYASNIEIFRALLLASIVATLITGCASVLLRPRPGHGLAGLVLALVSLLLGGPRAEAVSSESIGISAGLDYFILSLLVLGMLFVPMERLWPLRPQRIFRRGWQTDLTHFFTNHVGIQILGFLSVVPVQLLFEWTTDSPLQRGVRAQPVWLQLIEVLLVVELASYWTHRAFHRVPLLWRYHAIHHSVEQMDWLAGSRLHLVDVVVTRLAGFLPVFVVGFSPAAVYAYLAFVSFHAVYIHANVRHRWPGIRRVITTPEFHHWHHASTPEAIDRNFAVLLSCIDTLFGTDYRPEHWPPTYGLADERVPETWTAQLLHPFRRQRAE